MMDNKYVIDCDEYGRPVNERYQRLGARGVDEEGLFVRFEPGFGLNVIIGFRRGIYKQGNYWPLPPQDKDEMVLSIDGWEKLCSLVDEYRARESNFRVAAP